MKHSDCKSCFPDMSLLAGEVVRQEKIIEKLRKENEELKKENKKPVFREPKLSKKPKKKKGKSKDKKSSKAKKEAKIPKFVETKTETIDCEPEDLPEGAKFHDSYNVSTLDIKITLQRTVYKVKRYTFNGRLISGKAPVDGKFGSTLKALVLFLNHASHGSHLKVKEALSAFGVNISAGSLNKILNTDNEVFHTEVDRLLATGLKESEYIQVDDTGAYHAGDNYVSTVIGNEDFAVFRTTKSKSRTQFLETLLGSKPVYLLNSEAFAYARSKGASVTTLAGVSQKGLLDKETFEGYLKNTKIQSVQDLRHLREGALLAALKKRLGKELVVVSDGAGQFDIFKRGLCWIHAERHFRELVADTEKEDLEIEAYRSKIWRYYKALKRYKRYPSDEKRQKIEDKFDELFNVETKSVVLSGAVKNFLARKEELLLVLKNPSIPLHNNLSENHIRDFVVRRKVSPTTRSEDGKKGRDTFLSIKKTCKKFRLNFLEYLHDRLSGKNEIPGLDELLKQRLATI